MISRHSSVIRSAIAVAALVAGFFILLRSANAQDGALTPEQDAAYTQRLFAVAPGKDSKTYACFVRTYDPAHLATHPKQKVAAMKLLVTSEYMTDDSRQHFSFRLGLKYRHRTGNFDSSGDCAHAGIFEGTKGQPRISCSVDCDGGGVSFGLTPDNKAAMLYVERVRIWRGKDPDVEASDSLVGGADDRVFRLDRTTLDNCAALVEDRQELAAMRSVANKH